LHIPTDTIDSLYYTVTRITTHHYTDSESVNPSEISKATGFFYSNKQNSLFLVTNRHVLVNEDKGYFPNIARIMLHVNQSDIKQNEYYDIALYTKAKKMWIESNVKVDVVAIPIEMNKLPQGSIIVSFNVANLLQSNIQLHVGDDIVVMGYPFGVYDDIHNLPILRNGIIASAYPIPFRDKPYFLVDSDLEEGVSGSPVITKFKDTWRTRNGSKPPIGFSFFLLGIISSTFEFPEGEKPIGLNATYFAEVIDQITSYGRL
jgi:V8-like Glu-specific endopeptidase